MGIEPTNRGFADLFVGWFFLLNLKDLCLTSYRLGTTLGPNCTRGFSTADSPAAVRCARFVRESSPHHWSPGQADLRYRELQILFRDSLRTRVNMGALARNPQSPVDPLSQAILMLRSSLLNASCSVHRIGVTSLPAQARCRRTRPHQRQAPPPASRAPLEHLLEPSRALRFHWLT